MENSIGTGRAFQAKKRKEDKLKLMPAKGGGGGGWGARGGDRGVGGCGGRGGELAGQGGRGGGGGGDRVGSRSGGGKRGGGGGAGGGGGGGGTRPKYIPLKSINIMPLLGKGFNELCHSKSLSRTQ